MIKKKPKLKSPKLHDNSNNVANFENTNYKNYR